MKEITEEQYNHNCRMLDIIPESFKHYCITIKSCDPDYERQCKIEKVRAFQTTIHDGSCSKITNVATESENQGKYKLTMDNTPEPEEIYDSSWHKLASGIAVLFDLTKCDISVQAYGSNTLLYDGITQQWAGELVEKAAIQANNP